MGSGLELFARRKDGTELPIEVSLSPLRTDGQLTVSAAIRDVSQRKQTEAAATLAAQRLVSAVESIQDAFALFDHERRLVLCNSAYRHLLRGAAAGLLQREVDDPHLVEHALTLRLATEQELEHEVVQVVAARRRCPGAPSYQLGKNSFKKP